jgi:hypothetical protein
MKIKPHRAASRKMNSPNFRPVEEPSLHIEVNGWGYDHEAKTETVSMFLEIRDRSYQVTLSREQADMMGTQLLRKFHGE